MTLLPAPAESSGAQESSGNRAAFLLGTFLWPRKEKYLARGCENPQSNNSSRSDSFSTATGELTMRGRSQFIGSAGQYYVAYCLTVRGFHAAITLGDVPDVDVVVANTDGSRLLSIQVKTSRWAYRSKRYGYELREWDVGGSAVGRYSPNLWYAFVDLQESDPGCNPLVFVVPSLWVSNFVKAEWGRKMYMLRLDSGLSARNVGIVSRASWTRIRQ
jgi:hypothetical protein